MHQFRDIFVHFLICCLVIAGAASCTTPSVRDTDGSGSITRPVTSVDEAVPDNKTPSPKIEAKVSEPTTDTSAPFHADQDLAPLTEPPRQTTTSTTPKPPGPASVEPPSQELTPVESSTERLTRSESPKREVVIHEKPKVQKPAASIPIKPVDEPQRKRVAMKPERDAPPEEEQKMAVTKTEKAKSEVKLETEPPDIDKTDVVATHPESMLDRPILPKKPTVTATEPPTMTLESLPMTFGTQWTVDRAPNPMTDKTECILTSMPVNIFDGYEQTEVQLYLTSSAIFAKTQSHIDLSYPETGLRVDSSRLRTFEKVAKLTNAVISSEIDGVLASMVPGQQVVVRLGFWPTWPVTSTREAVFQLEGFPEAFRALRACEEM